MVKQTYDSQTRALLQQCIFLQFSFFHSDLVRVKTSSVTNFFTLIFHLSSSCRSENRWMASPGINESGAAKSRFSVGKKLGAEGEGN